MGSGKFYRYKPKKKKTLKSKVNSLTYKVALNKPEVKELYKLRASAASVAGDVINPLCNMAQGNANGTRVGNKIRLRSLTWRFITELFVPDIYAGTDSTQAVWTLTGISAQMRIIIYVNTQNDKGVALSIGQILRHVGSQQDKLNSVYNEDFVGYKKKYKILMDKYIDISNTSGMHFKEINKYCKLSYNINYDGNAGTSADIIDNEIYVLQISNNTDLRYQWSSILRYTDA